MRIAISQLNPVVGDFEGNIRQIEEAYKRACSEHARLLLTSELSLCGYPPHDLLERPEIYEMCEQALMRLAKITASESCALVVGHVAQNPGAVGKPAQNRVSVLEKGRIVFTQAKTLLPTYDVFDESRFFEPAPKVGVWKCDDTPIAFAICEDLWAESSVYGRKPYERDLVSEYQKLGAKLVVSLSASPYEWGKRERRESLHQEIVSRSGLPLIYVNQVGATDEILFDGASFAFDGKARLQGRLPLFQSSFGVLEWERGDLKWISPTVSGREDVAPDEMEAFAQGLVLGIREYFRRTGFGSALIGLSGGIDSAVVGALVTQALGPKNVRGVAMPSQHSSGHSLEDAEALAQKLGIAFEVRPIKFMYSVVGRELRESRGELAPLAEENLQARLRGVILMTLANHYRALIVTTGNKSELATGYCTLYGDMCGALAPVGDVLKTRVYELAHWINAHWGGVIPERSITKAPSAELRPDQKDQDTLPEYSVLDAFLEDYIEKRVGMSELRKRHEAPLGGSKKLNELVRMIEGNEYKRRQAAPVLKVSPKAFGIGRRVPIAKYHF